MANTYVKIASVTVGSGGASTVDFTSIPSTYTDLLVRVSARKTTTGGSNLQLQFNGSTTTYTQRTIIGNGSTIASYNDASEIGFMYVTTSSETANTFNSTDIYLPNYAGSNNKSVSIDSVTENNASSANATLTAALWSTSAAINRVYLQIANGGGVFAQHSTVTLYGIKNS